ncbi:MAG: flavodoxin family protein [Phycisphaerae bacterium]
MKCLILIGSRNPQGQTAQVADALTEGFSAAGGEVEKVFLTECELERCRQCDEQGWGLCRSEGRCVIEDDFASLVEKLRASEACVFATPVYFGSLSESMRAFLDRLRRITRHEAGKADVAGKPATAVCVAGGGGGGAPQCCRDMEQTLNQAGLDTVDVIPARRQNLSMKLTVARTVGKWLAGCPTS